MKVFVSSLISGFWHERQACRGAIIAQRHEPVMAEDFEASLHSPQVACLQGLRSADLVVLVLGESYANPSPARACQRRMRNIARPRAASQ